MKKKILVILIALLIVFPLGCQKEDKYSKYTRIVILSNKETDDSKILFMDNDHKIIYQLESQFIYEAIYIDDKLYVGKDKNNYQTIDCVTVEFTDDIYIKEGILLHYSKNGSYIVYLDGKCNVIDKEGNKKELEGYLLTQLVCNDCFYMVDYSNYLYCYNLSDYTLKSKIRLFNSEYISLTEVNDKCYIVSSKGFTLIEENEVTETFVYPYDFNEISNVRKDLIFVRENNEPVVYRVSFDEYKMILEPVYDEVYYADINFNELFEDYYKLGYKVVYYGEK
ncbi:MAG: hypothetical protein GX914_06980 [Erysipelotrichia bacterium]|nr:hypothetical protein [Erysipelotrichia bacterium]